MSKHSKALVDEKSKRFRRKLNNKAKERLAVILDDLTEHILHGADKIARFTNQKEINKDAVDVAAHVNIRSKEVRALKRV